MKFKAIWLILFLLIFSTAALAQNNRLSGFWGLISIKEDGNDIAAPLGRNGPKKRSFYFVTKSRLNLLASCNHIVGKYMAGKGGKFKFTSSYTTAMACLGEEGRFETALKKVMAAVTKYRIKGNLLTLQDESGINSVTLTVSPKVD